jgi:hypothetical protein
MHKKLLVFFLATTVCSIAMATPKTPPVPATSERISAQDLGPRFKTLDVNLDGSISQAEANADPMIASRFSALDATHDRKLSKYEFSQIIALSVLTYPLPLFGRIGS